MKNEKNLYIAVGIVSILACTFWYFHSKPGAEGGSTVTYGQVDSLRKETQIKKEMERRKATVDNYKSAPVLSNSYRQVEDEQNNKSGIKFESERHSVARDSEVTEEEAVPVNMLESQINKRLVNEQEATRFSAQQKQKFIENYKKQALAKGYLVELNDQLVVTKVQKVSNGAAGAKKGPASIPQEDVEIQEFDEDEGAD